MLGWPPKGVLPPQFTGRIPEVPSLMSAAETRQMSSVGREQMSAVERGQMSAAGTGRMSAVGTRQISTVAAGRRPF